ncbi:GGDEF domain-containing protein [bacterium]|nr:GGDEF domain-containing protein [bacterium]
MRNIIIYTTKKQSDIKDTLEHLDNIEELQIRVELSEDLKEYLLLNPSLLIVEDVPNLKDVLMTTKFQVPVLFVGEPINDVTIRALSYDYISKPINKDNLIVRINSLLKVKELHDKIDEVSTTDELTGLHNRKYLQERLDAEISRARRYKTPLSCLLFDIDFFKVVNDMYGYEWGDVLLRNLSDKLKQMIRKEDVLTRYGDEEFIVILPNTSEDNAFLFGERFRRDIEKMEFIPAGEEERHPITVSGGISTYPCLKNVEEDANTIIRYAEHALYNAKKRGKNKIVQFSQINLEF